MTPSPVVGAREPRDGAEALLPAASNAARERSVALFAHWERETQRRSRRKRLVAWLIVIGLLVAAGFWVVSSWSKLVQQYPALEAIAPASKDSVPPLGKKPNPKRTDASQGALPKADPSDVGASSGTAPGASEAAANGAQSGVDPQSSSPSAAAAREEMLPDMYRAGDVAPTLTFPDHLRIRSSGADTTPPVESVPTDSLGVPLWSDDNTRGAVPPASHESSELNPPIERNVPPATATERIVPLATATERETTASPGERSYLGVLEAASPGTPQILSTPPASEAASLPDVFAVHLSSFKHLEEAESDVRRFVDLGIEARAVLTEVPGKGPWYRVVTGRFATFPEARDEALRLAARIGLGRTHVVGKDGQGQPIPIFESDSETKSDPDSSSDSEPE